MTGTDPLDEQQLQLRAGAVAPLARDVVRVDGPDATAYLQGQCSQDLAGLEVGDSAWTLVLEPQGKVDAWLRATRLDVDTWLLDVDAGWGEAALARLRRFLLRTKATIEPDPGWVFHAVRGPVTVDLTHPSAVEVLTLPVWWRGLVGYDVAAPAGVPVELRAPHVRADALEAVRIECGVPAMGAELTVDTIPAEAGQWLIDASVSFTKGCYTGQELVARIDSRGGNVPRPVRGLVFDGDEVPPAGAAVVVDGAEVGRVTSATRSATLGAPVALAVVGRGVEVGAACSARWDDGSAEGQVRSLPLVGG